MTPRDPLPGGGESPPVRTYRDGAGVLWLVREQPGEPGHPVRCAALVFEADGVARRVRRYPPDWRSLDDASLEALSWRC